LNQISKGYEEIKKTEKKKRKEEIKKLEKAQGFRIGPVPHTAHGPGNKPEPVPPDSPLPL
jgi:hypothetical protein